MLLAYHSKVLVHHRLETTAKICVVNFSWHSLSLIPKIILVYNKMPCDLKPSKRVCLNKWNGQLKSRTDFKMTGIRFKTLNSLEKHLLNTYLYYIYLDRKFNMNAYTDCISIIPMSFFLYRQQAKRYPFLVFVCVEFIGIFEPFQNTTRQKERPCWFWRHIWGVGFELPWPNLLTVGLCLSLWACTTQHVLYFKWLL